MSATATAKVLVLPIHSNVNPLGNYKGNPNLAYSLSYTNKDISQVYAGWRTIAGQSEDLDLTTGLLDEFGATITLSNLKLLCIQNTDKTAVLTINGTALGTDSYTVGPMKCLYIDSVFPISGNKVIHVATSVAQSKYKVLILGN